jgi:hypothetical protein
MSFDDFIKNGSQDHAEQPQALADRLAAGLDRVEAPAQVVPFAHLGAHLFGGHLGQWRAGVDAMRSLRRLPAFEAGTAAAVAVACYEAALRLCSGDRAGLVRLALPDQAAALALAAAALCGRADFTAALATFGEALQLAATGLRDGSRALRALAVGGNNLAAALEEKGDRSAAETAGMLTAAEAGLIDWRRAGTWLEEERAEYRLAHCHLAASQAPAARASAERCIGVCERNDAPAFEQFFGWAVKAQAQRAAGDAAGFESSRNRALRALEQVPEDERTWSADERSALLG